MDVMCSRRAGPGLLTLTLMMAGLPIASAKAQPSPTPTAAPRSINDLECGVVGDFAFADLLIPPRSDFKPPNLTAPAGRNPGLSDPNGLCRYREANRSLPPATARRVVFLGDSITEYWALGDPGLFTGDTLNRGVTGQNTSQMLLRFREDVLQLHPAVVHIMAGVNDLNTRAGVVLTRSNIASMVDLARANGVQVVLASVTPSSHFWIAPDLRPGPLIAELNIWLKRYAAENHLLYVDYNTALSDGDLGLRPDFGNDGLHPNQRGYAVMGGLAREAIASALAEPDAPPASRR